MAEGGIYILQQSYNWSIDVGWFNNILRKNKIIIIIGPTGSGKTTLANYLCDKYSCFEIVLITTTREPRKEEKIEQYNYICEDDYIELFRNHRLVMTRIKKQPFYGYKENDVKKSLDNGKIPILLFRSSGFKCMCELNLNLDNVYLISLTCKWEDAALHSLDKILLDKKTDIIRVLDDNASAMRNIGLNEKHIELFNEYNDSFFSNSKLIDLLNNIKEEI